MPDLSFSCDCGAVKGELKGAAPNHGTRLVCYCKDCQAFMEYLGKSDKGLDRAGGTDIYQTLPSRLRITEGADKLACIRLTEKGPLRWYASCCNTPIGNTAPGRGLSFVGLITYGLRGDGVENAVGPSRGVVYPEGARSDLSEKKAAIAPVMGALAMRALSARLTGKYRQTPFFDDAGAPVADPVLLGHKERAEIDQRMAARP